MVSRVRLRKSWMIKTTHNVAFAPFLLLEYAVGTRLHRSTVAYRSRGFSVLQFLCTYLLLASALN